MQHIFRNTVGEPLQHCVFESKAMGWTLRDICFLLAPNVDVELLTEYIPRFIVPIWSNQLGLKSLLQNLLERTNAHIMDNHEVEHMLYFLKLCGLLYCDSNTPRDLKQLIMGQLIPKYSHCIRKADFNLLKEMWLFCIRLSRSKSRQQQNTAYFLFEQIVHLYAPKFIDVVYFEIRASTDLEGFLLSGLTFPPEGRSLGACSIQSATLNTIKQIINFAQPSFSDTTNRFLWNERDKTKWRNTWKSYIEL